MGVNVRSLIGKLNDPTRSALEAAAGFCLSRTHYDVEIEHYLMKLLDAGDTDFALKQAHVKQLPLRPRERQPNIPTDLDEIVMRALAKAPDDRLPGCQEFARLLDQVGKPVDDRKTGDEARQSVGRPPSSARKIGAAVLVAASAALLALVWALIR